MVAGVMSPPPPLLAVSFLSSPERSQILRPTIAPRASNPPPMRAYIAPLPAPWAFFFRFGVSSSSSSSSSSSRRFLAAVALAAAAGTAFFAGAGLSSSSSSSTSTVDLATGFLAVVAVGLVGAGVSSGAGVGLGLAAAGVAAAAAPLAAQPNGFLASADAAGAAAGTVICILHDVQRIVLPARFSGTSKAALHPEQVIGMAIGFPRRDEWPAIDPIAGRMRVNDKTTQPRGGIGSFPEIAYRFPEQTATTF
jgi:hypothetical protein